MLIENCPWGELVANLLEKIHRERPLIHHITNFVVMNDTANLTLSLGGLPVMAHAREEVAEMVEMAGALVLNPGTLSPEWIDSMLIAGRRANELGIPIVLDPVGAGATQLRTESNTRMLEELQIAVLRGNSGEIGALAGADGKVKGVESISQLAAPLAVARTLSTRYKTTVAITGKRDIISTETETIAVDNGHILLTTITGTGCMATTAIALFAAVEHDFLFAATAGLICFGIAAELAADQAQGPGSFKTALLDVIYHLTPEQLVQRANAQRLRS
ncbi:hydroxyethylthiazole kinase [Candidatus Acetothermia bacterium]|jgi:hydroxyethylthiazole kinase|nr:hydroxyethylthiazole kinase [Candidatus Acetothermia bacterium]MCI2427909.1 hydroxyethylthiazole kinase [Candidatus Acetothermia bacterium]MCI2428910.1 hydroxyethylthiazole kinase [Candidatus Acetothermia bacterium]